MKIRKRRIWLDNIIKRLNEENLNPDGVEICQGFYILRITKNGDYFIYIPHKNDFLISYGVSSKRIHVMNIEKVIELIKFTEERINGATTGRF